MLDRTTACRTERASFTYPPRTGVLIPSCKLYRTISPFVLDLAGANGADGSLNTYRYLYTIGHANHQLLIALFVVQDLYRMALQEHPRQRLCKAKCLRVRIAVLWPYPASPLTFLPGQFPAHRFDLERSMNFDAAIFAAVTPFAMVPIKSAKIVVNICNVLFPRRVLSTSSGQSSPQDTRLVSTVLLAFMLCVW